MGAVGRSKASPGYFKRVLPQGARRVPDNEATLLYQFGPFVLDHAAHRLMRDGRRVAIPAKAWQILLMLVEARGSLVTHEALRARLWPKVVVEDRTLTVHVSTLRKALSEGLPFDVIETVIGTGYRLAIPVHVMKPDEPPTRTVGRLSKVEAQAGPDLHSWRSRAAEAYLLQLEARAHLKPFARLPLMKALTLFEQALVLDPDHALAHAGLASTYLLMASTAMLRPLQVDEAMPMARRAALQAIALDEGLAEGWAALGRVKMEYDLDWDGAAADLTHAIALNRCSAEALDTYGQLLSAMGRHDEAIEVTEQARRLDPRSVETLQHLAIVYWMADQTERALRAMGASLAISPDAPRAHYGRMLILDQFGRHDEAMSERLAALRGLNVAEGFAERVEAVARSEGWRAAMEMWIGLLERTNRWEGAATQWMAVGEPERTLDALEHCVRVRTTHLRFTGQSPCFRPLHDDPRFQAILRTLNLDGRTGSEPARPSLARRRALSGDAGLGLSAA